METPCLIKLGLTDLYLRNVFKTHKGFKNLYLKKKNFIIIHLKDLSNKKPSFKGIVLFLECCIRYSEAC